VGGNRAKPALYCPYEVMVGLTTKTKPRGDAQRMLDEKGWEKLEHHFPNTYSKFEALDIRGDQSYRK
jgi:hypothetical protein